MKSQQVQRVFKNKLLKRYFVDSGHKILPYFRQSVFYQSRELLQYHFLSTFAIQTSFKWTTRFCYEILFEEVFFELCPNQCEPETNNIHQTNGRAFLESGFELLLIERFGELFFGFICHLLDSHHKLITFFIVVLQRVTKSEIMLQREWNVVLSKPNVIGNVQAKRLLE